MGPLGASTHLSSEGDCLVIGQRPGEAPQITVGDACTHTHTHVLSQNIAVLLCVFVSLNKRSYRSHAAFPKLYIGLMESCYDSICLTQMAWGVAFGGWLQVWDSALGIYASEGFLPCLGFRTCLGFQTCLEKWRSTLPHRLQPE